MSIHHSNTGRNWPKCMERLCATEASLSKWVPDQVRSNSFACVRVPDRIFVPVRIACWWLCSDQSHFCCIAFNYPSMVGPGSGRFYQILLCATVIFIPTIVINKWSSTETKECRSIRHSLLKLCSNHHSLHLKVRKATMTLTQVSIFSFGPSNSPTCDHLV